MGKGKFWHPAGQKPLNRSSPHLIHVIICQTKFGRDPSRGSFSLYTRKYTLRVPGQFPRIASPVAVLRSSPPKLGVQWSEALAIFQAAHIRSLHQSMKLLNVKISSRIISLQCKQISDSQAFRSTQRSNFKPYSWWQISLHRDNRERKAQNWRCNCNPCSKVELPRRKSVRSWQQVGNFLNFSVWAVEGNVQSCQLDYGE